VLAGVKASKLKVSCFGHASGNELGGFSTGIPGEFSVAHFGDVDMQIDSVPQGTRNLGTVALNLSRGTDTFLQNRVPVSTGTGVHGRRQHKLSGKGQGACCPANGDFTVFEGLTLSPLNLRVSPLIIY